MIIIWIVFVLGVIGVHLHLIKDEKKSPKKGFWLAVRVAVAVVLIFIEWRLQIRSLWLLIPTYFFAGWVPHDTIIPMGMGKKPWYTNSTGHLDKWQGSNPMIWLAKLLGLATTLTMYILNEVPV